MTRKEFLRQYLRAKRQFDNAVRDLEECRSRYEGIRAIVYSDMPKAHDTEHDLSEIFAKMEKETAKCAATCRAALSVMAKVERAIESVKDDTEKQLLRLRYIHGMTWQTIADTMGYTERWVHILHGRALENVKLSIERGKDGKKYG